MNIPDSWLMTSNTIMMVGVGGGFDIFTGLPFVKHYPNKKFILVNSSSDSSFLYQESDNTRKEHYPQNKISPANNIIANYTVGKLGAGLLKVIYNEIFQKHQADIILGIDGGVDSLMVGDEQESGTILEDFNVLGALDQIDCEHKILCCAGFGAETEENINHYRALENISNIIVNNGFIGSFSICDWHQEFHHYKNQCENAWDKDRKSHIQTKIISAAKGAFVNNSYKDVDAKVFQSTGIEFVSPLTSIYWMFDMDVVISLNKLIPSLKKANTFIDSKAILRQYLSDNKMTRTKEVIPL